MWKWWMNSPFLLWFFFFFYLTPCVTTSRHPVKPWAPIGFVPLFFYIRQVDFICGCCRIISTSTVDTVVVIMWPLAPLRLVGWWCQSSNNPPLDSLFCDTKHISINPRQSMFCLFNFFLATMNLGMKATSWACVISLMKATKHSASLMPRRTRISFFFQGSAHKHLSGWKLINVCSYIYGRKRKRGAGNCTWTQHVRDWEGKTKLSKTTHTNTTLICSSLRPHAW